MTLNELRRMVRHSLNAQIRESVGRLSSPPDTLNDFRRSLASCLNAAGAPPDLVEEVADLDLQGGGVFGSVWSAWENIEAELKGLKGPELKDAWIECIEFYVHDCVIDMIDEWKNPMNYEPGRRVEVMDASRLAKDVVSVMLNLIGA